MDKETPQRREARLRSQRKLGTAPKKAAARRTGAVAHPKAPGPQTQTTTLQLFSQPADIDPDDIKRLRDYARKMDAIIAKTAGSGRLEVRKIGAKYYLAIRGRTTTQRPTATPEKTAAAEIIERVTSWAGSKAAAEKWFRNQPIPALGDQTAEGLVRTGQAKLVRQYLDAIAVGGFA